MPRLGDLTLDCPVITSKGVGTPGVKEDSITALEWALEYVKRNNVPVSVRVVMNPHDFGSYPSLEVDYHYDKCPNNDFGEMCTVEDCRECAEEAVATVLAEF